jgi:hypothetical protein
MLQPERFYVPGHAGAEAATAQRMQHWKQVKADIQQNDAAERD